MAQHGKTPIGGTKLPGPIRKTEPLPPRTSAETYRIMAWIFAAIAVVVVTIMIVVSVVKTQNSQDCAATGTHCTR